MRVSGVYPQQRVERLSFYLGDLEHKNDEAMGFHVGKGFGC